jgi:hypothetical protein
VLSSRSAYEQAALGVKEIRSGGAILLVMRGAVAYDPPAQAAKEKIVATKTAAAKRKTTTKKAAPKRKTAAKKPAAKRKTAARK